MENYGGLTFFSVSLTLRAVKQPIVRPDGDLTRCCYMLPQKKRYCRMLVRAGKRFCGEHAVFDPEDQTRIVCPLDPKHTVYRTDLKDHLATRCNRRLADDPWIKENINVVATNECEGDAEVRHELLAEYYFAIFIRCPTQNSDDMQEKRNSLTAANR